MIVSMVNIFQEHIFTLSLSNTETCVSIYSHLKAQGNVLQFILLLISGCNLYIGWADRKQSQENVVPKHSSLAAHHCPVLSLVQIEGMERAEVPHSFEIKLSLSLLVLVQRSTVSSLMTAGSRGCVPGGCARTNKEQLTIILFGTFLRVHSHWTIRALTKHDWSFRSDVSSPFRAQSDSWSLASGSYQSYFLCFSALCWFSETMAALSKHMDAKCTMWCHM